MQLAGGMRHGGRGSVSVFLNDGSAKVALAAGFPVEISSSSSSLQVGDLNGDGAADIVLVHSAANNGNSVISVLLASP